jgi:hypothetical protein
MSLIPIAMTARIYTLNEIDIEVHMNKVYSWWIMMHVTNQYEQISAPSLPCSMEGVIISR